MLGEKYDLANVIGIVGKLPVDGLEHGVRFGPDGDGALHIFGPERFDRREHARPARFPQAHDIGASGFGRQFEFLVAMAIRLLAIGSKKISGSRTHVASQMLHDDGDGIRLGVKSDEQFFVF